jgi:hypothetical protein
MPAPLYSQIWCEERCEEEMEDAIVGELSPPVAPIGHQGATAVAASAGMLC